MTAIKTISLKSEFEAELPELRLKQIISSMESVIIAYSGGVDSTLLICMAREILGDRAVAVTAISPTYPPSELDEAVRAAGEIGIKHIVIESCEMENELFAANDTRRCYHCKKELYSILGKMACEMGLKCVADGSNLDDIRDYRPGREAAREEAVRSPFIEAAINKETIRLLSRKYNLASWNKPAQACLSSRVPYGLRITKERLNLIYQGEQILKDAGFPYCRLRYHDSIARIEVPEAAFDDIMIPGTREKITKELKNLGFTYIVLDMEGYRTGSMNEMI